MELSGCGGNGYISAIPAEDYTECCRYPRIVFIILFLILAYERTTKSLFLLLNSFRFVFYAISKF